MSSLITTLPVLPIEIWHLVFSYFGSKLFTQHDLTRICLVSKLWLINQKYLYERVVVIQTQDQSETRIHHSLILNPKLCLLAQHLVIEVQSSRGINFSLSLQDSSKIDRQKVDIEWLFIILTNCSNLKSITVRSGCVRHPVLFLHLLQHLCQDITSITYHMTFIDTDGREFADVFEYLCSFKKLKELDVSGSNSGADSIKRTITDTRFSSSLTRLLLPQIRDVSYRLINLVEQQSLEHLRIMFDPELFTFISQSSINNLTSLTLFFKTTPNASMIQQCSTFIAKNEKLVSLNFGCPRDASRTHILATITLLQLLPSTIETLITPSLTRQRDLQIISTLWNGSCSELHHWYIDLRADQRDIIEILKETELRIPTIYAGLCSTNIKKQGLAISEFNECTDIRCGEKELSPSLLSGLAGILKKMLQLLPSIDSDLLYRLLLAIQKLCFIPGFERYLAEDAPLVSLLEILSASPFSRTTSVAISILAYILLPNEENVLPDSLEFMQTVAKRYLDFGMLNILENYLAPDCLEGDCRAAFSVSCLIRGIVVYVEEKFAMDSAIPIINMLLKQVLLAKSDDSSVDDVIYLALFVLERHPDAGQIDAQTCALLIPYLEISTVVQVDQIIEIMVIHCRPMICSEQHHLTRTQIYLDAGILEKLDHLLKTLDQNDGVDLILQAAVEFVNCLDKIYLERVINTSIIQNLVSIQCQTFEEESFILLLNEVLQRFITDYPSRISELIAQGVLTFLHSCISTKFSAPINAIAIDSINDILEAGAKNLEVGAENPYLVSINALHILPDIQKLQDPDILFSFKSSFNIINKFYPERACLNVVQSKVSSQLNALLEEFPSTKTIDDNKDKDEVSVDSSEGPTAVVTVDAEIASIE